jgi:hypothetical protein
LRCAIVQEYGSTQRQISSTSITWSFAGKPPCSQPKSVSTSQIGTICQHPIHTTRFPHAYF